jgi:hypothetical protein
LRALFSAAWAEPNGPGSERHHQRPDYTRSRQGRHQGAESHLSLEGPHGLELPLPTPLVRGQRQGLNDNLGKHPGTKPTSKPHANYITVVFSLFINLLRFYNI